MTKPASGDFPGTPLRLAKPTTNLFRERSKKVGPGLDVSGLSRVLEVDPEAMTAEVQGMCTYEDLVAATLPHGLVPYVVPQLRTITLGYADDPTTPALVAAISPVRLVVLAVLAAAVFGTVALVSASMTVRGARGATLRENAR